MGDEKFNKVLLDSYPREVVDSSMKLKVYFNDGTDEIKEFNNIDDYDDFIEFSPYAFTIVDHDGNTVFVTKIENMEGVVLYAR